MINLKNSHYKSVTQFYNNDVQAIEDTNTITNPLVLDLGIETLDTGVSLDNKGKSINVKSTGVYGININSIIGGTTAGQVTLAVAVNGVILPESVRTITVTTTSVNEVAINIVVYLPICCAIGKTVTVVAYSDETGEGNVLLSGNVVKLA